MDLIRIGATGQAVHDVQQRLADLGIAIDTAEHAEARYGAATEAAVRAFQRLRRLPADGIVGEDTWSQLVEAGWALGDRPLYLHEPPFRGDDVLTLQRKLNALGFDTWKEDGIFGRRVDEGVRRFQRNVGIEADGIVSTETTEALERMRPDLALPSRAVVREEAGARDQDLAGAVIAIDPGHGPSDPGTTGPSGTSEHERTEALAEALAAELEARGGRPILLRTATEDPSPAERAAAANDLGAAICLSLHLNDGDPAAEGATCMYYGSAVSLSVAGERLAEAIQTELVQRMGLRDCRTHGMTLTILRETQMPAVQVEPCFLTNPREEALLQEDAFVRDLARSIAIGVETFLAAR